MKNTNKETSFNIVIGIVVIVAVMVMIVSEVSKVNQDNSISRKASVSATK